MGAWGHYGAAGHHQPALPPETPRHSQASLGQSLVGSLPLSPGFWCTQGFVCALQKSVSPVLCKFYNQIPLPSKVKFPGGSQSLCQIHRLGNLLWALELLQQCKNFFGVIVLPFVGHLLSGSMVEVMASSPKRTYATCPTSQVCCSQSPCPRDRPLLTRASAGDAETLKVWSESVSYEGHCSFLWVLVHTRFCLCPLSVCVPICLLNC